MFSALIISQILSVTLRIILMQWLGKNNFSIYSMFYESVLFLSAFLTLGLPQSLVRFGLLEKRVRYHFSGVLLLFAIYAVIAIVVISLLHNTGVTFFNNQTLNQSVLLIAFTAPLFALPNYLSAFFNAHKQIKPRALLLIMQRGLIFLMVLTGVYSGGIQSGIYGFFLPSVH